MTDLIHPQFIKVPIAPADLTTPIGRLRQQLLYFELSNTGTTGDVLRSFCLARQHFELTNTAGDYPLISLYADWLVHTELNRKRANVFMQKLRDAFVKLKANGHRPSIEEFLDIVNQAFAIGELRQEWLRFATTFDLPRVMFTERNPWFAFLSAMTRDILGKPLIWGKGGLPVNPDKLTALPHTLQMVFLESDSNTKVVDWKVEFTTTWTLTGEIRIFETKDF